MTAYPNRVPHYGPVSLTARSTAYRPSCPCGVSTRWPRRAALAGVLDTLSGKYAQLVAAALILRNLTRLPDPDGLAASLHRHTDALLA
jgi:hypothetical protein